MTGLAKRAKHRASTIYKKFHNAVSHEEQVILFNYLVLFVVIVIYTVIGMAYYAALYADVDDDATLSVAPYSWFRALYFLTQTMTSLGYGDMYPTTQGSRLFTAFYILFGVCLGGTYIGLVNSHIQEHSERLADLRDKEIGKKLSKIHDRKIFSRIKKFLRTGISKATSMSSSKGTNNNMTTTSVNAEPLASSKGKENKNMTSSKGINVNNDDDSDDKESDDSDEDDPNEADDGDDDNDDDDDDDAPKNKKRMGRLLKKQVSLANLVIDDPYGLSKEEEHKLLDVSEEAYTKELRRLVIQFCFDVFIICIAVFVGMGAMIGFEGWTPIEAFYWATVTIATVGYGDYHPTNNQSRAFVIVYTLVGTSLLVKSLTNIVKIPTLLRVRRKEMNIIKLFGGETHELTAAVFKEVIHAELYRQYPTIKRSKHELNKAEFVILILSMMHKIKDKDLIFACKLFDKIDKNGDKVLDQKDIDEEVTRLEKIELEHIIHNDVDDDENNFDYNADDINDNNDNNFDL